MLAGWSDLIESEVVAGAERTLIVEFLDFVERHFPRLGPFATLGRCKDHPFRVKRRLNAVLDEIAGSPTKHWLELPSRSTVDRAYLKFQESPQQIRLAVYPAGTLTQAKAFYTRPGAASSLGTNILDTTTADAQPRYDTRMRLLLTALAGLIGLWLGWYYGAGLGYSLWPDSEWIGAAFSYLIGAPLGAFAAAWLATKVFGRIHKRSAP